MCAIDFLVPLRGKTRQDKITRFAEKKVPRPVLDDEAGAPTLRLSRGRCEGFPNALAAVDSKAAKFPITADAVYETIFDKRRAHRAVEMARVPFAHLPGLPRNSWSLRFEAQHERTIIKTGKKELFTDFSRS